MKESRIIRIAQGSGRPVRDVLDMLEEYKRLAKMWSNVIKRLRKSNKGDTNAQHLSKSLPPEILTQIGGIGGLRSLLNQTVSKEMAVVIDKTSVARRAGSNREQDGIGAAAGGRCYWRKRAELAGAATGIRSDRNGIGEAAGVLGAGSTYMQQESAAPS
ncbi:Signal recognition particle 54 kDa protein 2 [Hordeum vulgare]|nr:Signal recognition particle 54 kDa protein 2 [Hordeum vulgare]